MKPLTEQQIEAIRLFWNWVTEGEIESYSTRNSIVDEFIALQGEPTITPEIIEKWAKSKTDLCIDEIHDVWLWEFMVDAVKALQSGEIAKWVEENEEEIINRAKEFNE